jgi:hypothetical protein
MIDGVCIQWLHPNQFSEKAKNKKPREIRGVSLLLWYRAEITA